MKAEIKREINKRKFFIFIKNFEINFSPAMTASPGACRSVWFPVHIALSVAKTLLTRLRARNATKITILPTINRLLNIVNKLQMNVNKNENSTTRKG